MQDSVIYAASAVAFLALTALPATASTFEFKRTVPQLVVGAPTNPLPPALADLQAQPQVLNFGNTLVGTHRSLTVVVSNEGGAGSNWTQVPTITGTSTAQFAITNHSCTGILAPGGQCSVQVRYLPTALQAHVANLVLAAEGSSLSISLNGVGVSDAEAVGAWTLPTKTLGDPDFGLSAPVSGGAGAWSFVSETPAVATVSGSLVSLVSAGEASLVATQAASATNPLRTFRGTLKVQKMMPEVEAWTVPAVAVQEFIDLPIPVSSSTGAVTFSSSNPGVARVVGGQLEGRAQGTVVIYASQQETDTHRAFQWAYTATVLPRADVAWTTSPFETRQGTQQTLTQWLQNTGTAPIVIGSNSISVSSRSGIFFKGADNCRDITLQPGQSCSVQVRLSGTTNSLRPAAAGVHTGSLSLNTSTQAASAPLLGTVTARGQLVLPGGRTGPRAPFSSNLGLMCFDGYGADFGGTGSQYFCAGNWWMSNVSGNMSCQLCAKYLDKVAYSTKSLSFGTHLANASVPPLQVMVTNQEDYPIVFSQVATTGSTAFSAVSNCASLAPGASCLAEVSFQPTTGGAFSGKLRLVSNAEDSPHLVSLSGASQFLASNIGEWSLPAQMFGSSPMSLTPPTSNSPGGWAFSSSNTSVAQISGNVLTIQGAGTTTITATQFASGAYGPGSTSALLTVSKATPSVTGWALPSPRYSEGSIALPVPSSNSPGSWVYTSSNPAVATVSGNVLTLVGVGDVTLTATQASTANFNGASTTGVLTVQKGLPTLGAWADQTQDLDTGSFSLTLPTSNSGGTWSVQSSNPAVATVTGTTVSLLSAGTTTLTATQASTDLYESAQRSLTLTVASAMAYPRTCLEVLQQNPGSPTGTYTVYPTGEAPSARSVYCDMTTAGGGWTLLGRWTNWSSTAPALTSQQVMVRGSNMVGFSNNAGSMPAYQGPNLFDHIRYVSGDANWNAAIGVVAAEGLMHPTWSSWPSVTARSQYRVAATRLDGTSYSSIAAVSLRQAAWWTTGGVQGTSGASQPYSLFTVDTNTGICGGENRVATYFSCGTANYLTSRSNHFDIVSTKWLWGR